MCGFYISQVPNGPSTCHATVRACRSHSSSSLQQWAQVLLRIAGQQAVLTRSIACRLAGDCCTWLAMATNPLHVAQLSNQLPPNSSCPAHSRVGHPQLAVRAHHCCVAQPAPGPSILLLLHWLHNRLGRGSVGWWCCCCCRSGRRASLRLCSGLPQPQVLHCCCHSCLSLCCGHCYQLRWAVGCWAWVGSLWRLSKHQCCRR